MKELVTLLGIVGLTQIILYAKILAAGRRSLFAWLTKTEGKTWDETGAVIDARRADDPRTWTRADYLIELLHCPLCVGFWAGLILGGTLTYACAGAVASLAVDGLLDKLTGDVNGNDAENA